IQFEPSHKLVKASSNEALPKTLRYRMGEVSLFVTDAAWRLMSAGTIRVGSSDRPGGPGDAAIRKLGGRRLRKGTVRRGCFLTMQFERGLVLEVLPIASRFNKKVDNYSLLLPKRSIAVVAGGGVHVEASTRSSSWGE